VKNSPLTADTQSVILTLELMDELRCGQHRMNSQQAATEKVSK